MQAKQGCTIKEQEEKWVKYVEQLIYDARNTSALQRYVSKN